LIPTSSQFVDVHCHCLPNVDDGPESIDEALALCRALVDDGIGLVVATPHQLGRFETRAGADRAREAVQRLNRELSTAGLDLTVLPGAEVRLDERIIGLLAQDEILTLADRSRHILLELPYDVFIDIEPLLAPLISGGIGPVIAHPERNMPLLEHTQALRGWLAGGASLQVTAASLTGDFGSWVERAAWRLMREGWVDIVATDAHDCRSSPPRMTMAFAEIGAGLGRDLAHLLCIDNPSRVVRGERLVPARTWGKPEIYDVR
jgi:protein-tyrosine phosphatase